MKEKEVLKKMTEQAQEIIDNEEKEESFIAEELNQDNDLVGLDKMEFPEMNFDLNI